MKNKIEAAKPGHLKNNEWLHCPTISSENKSKTGKSVGRIQRALSAPVPELNWKKKD